MSNEINLFGEIGRTADGSGITAQQVKTMIASADQTQPLIVHIDSPGGSVFDGLAIYEAFAKYPGPKKAIVESTAFSIASYIAMAFDEVEIAENGYLMIHEPYGGGDGTASELRRDAELLDKLDQSMVAAYAKKTGLSELEVRSHMKAETYYNATEAMSFGFVNSVSTKAVATRITPTASYQKKMPHRVFAALFGAGSSGDSVPEKETSMAEVNKPVAASVKQIKAAFPKMKADFVVRCLEQELPLESVATSAAEELMIENEALTSVVQSLEAELMQLKLLTEEAESVPATETETETVPLMMEDDEEELVAKATARGTLRPVARSKAKGSSFAGATAKWDAAIVACVAKAGSRQRAAIMANKQNPGLREQMLAECKAKR